MAAAECPGRQASKQFTAAMSDSAGKISREELYQRIWSTPFVRLAKELGYSYTELVAICAQLNLPRPAGDYWYRLAHGGASEREPLPAPAPGAPAEIPLGPRALNADTTPAEASDTEPPVSDQPDDKEVEAQRPVPPER